MAKEPTQLEATPADFRQLSRLAKDIYLFENLSISELDHIAERINLWEYPKGSVICKQDEPGNQFFIIYKGWVEVVVGRKVFRRGTDLAQLGPGDVFGEMALILGRPRSADVLAGDRPVHLFTVGEDIFSYLLRTNEEFADSVDRLAADRHMDTALRLSDD
jgi:CRP-like cAMP-binding protein